MRSQSFYEQLDKNEIESYFDFVNGDLNFFREGRNLSADDRRIIRSEDIWIVSYVNGIPHNWKTAIGDAFQESDKSHFMGLQRREWFGKEIELLTQELKREPTDLEIIADAEKHQNMVRFRLCYFLRFPKKMLFNPDNYRLPSVKDSIDYFLGFAEKIDPSERPYSYFDIICQKTFFEMH
jgi:hypothetical protein